MFTRKQYLPLIPEEEIATVNVNSREAKKAVVRKLTKSLKKRSPWRHFFLSILTFGYHAYKIHAFADLIIRNELAKRKIHNLKKVMTHIETIRKGHYINEPRHEINEIFMKIQGLKNDEGEQGVELKKIYSPNELLLFITNPIRETRVIKKPASLTRNNGYLQNWRQLRKKLKDKQFNHIEQINTCNTILSEEYGLTTEEINDRIDRTNIAKSDRSQLTKLKELLAAFQELVLAFQEYDELKESDPSLHAVFEVFRSLTDEDAELLTHFLNNEKTPQDLPKPLRKKIVRIANQKEIIDDILQKDLAHMCELILTTSQWNFFLRTQNLSSSTLKLFDWAYYQSSRQIPQEITFDLEIERCTPILEKREHYPELFEAAEAPEKLHNMCLFFADEIHRECPSLLVYDHGKEVFFLDRIEDLQASQLLGIFDIFQELAQGDIHLLKLLQTIISQTGKKKLLTYFYAEFEEIIGERSEYFIPVFSIIHIDISKESADKFTIVFHFHHRVFCQKEEASIEESPKGIHIKLILEKNEASWNLSSGKSSELITEQTEDNSPS